MGLGIDKIWQMIGNQRDSNKPTYAKATVLRKDDDGVIWVRIEGGVDETPVYSTTADVRPNDVVTVRVAGGKVHIEGSTSAPSVGVTEFGDVITAIGYNIRDAEQKAEQAKADSDAAISAAKAAEEATDVARVTGQHFWFNDDRPETYGGAGAHVTGQTKEEWVEEVRRGFPDVSEDEPYHNFLMNSLGILLRTALNNLVSITRSSIAFFDGLGNGAANVVAFFGKNGSKIGLDAESHVEIDYHSMKMVDRDGTAYLHVSDLRDRSGIATITYTYIASGDTTFWTLDPRAVSTDYSVTVSDGSGGTITKGIASVSFSTPPSQGAVIEVTYTTDSDRVKAFTFGRRVSGSNVGPLSFASGYLVRASGALSSAIGDYTTASGHASHAEGNESVASGYASHAEGYKSAARGEFSHAEGTRSVASGHESHAEGNESVASGHASHAQNTGTIAGYNSQTAIGEYNDNKSENAFEVGNGTSTDRSNALELDWDGKLTLSGDVIGKNGADLHKLSEKANSAALAKVESRTATTATPFGGLFMLDGNLYRATTDIAVGATINSSNSVQTNMNTKIDGVWNNCLRFYGSTGDTGASQDYDDYTAHGYWYVDTSMTGHAPETGLNLGILITFPTDEFVWQVMYSAMTAKIHHRHRNSAGVWSVWRTV